MLAAGCSTELSDETAQPGQRRQTEGPEPGINEADGEATALRPGAGLLLGTPIYNGDFADPYVLAAGDAFYAYSTNTRDANVPLLVVRNSPTARYAGDVMPDLPAWSEPGAVWGPAVLALDDRYILYFATRVRGTQMQCISRAVADHPEGPFIDDSTEPVVCQTSLGGSIDPSFVTDRDGHHRLLFKNDGNCCGIPTSIWSQPISEDGLDVVGDPSLLLTAEPGWEGDLIEGPSMVVTGDQYLLFYSANAWDSPDYAIGWASCESPEGPCSRVEDGPWMDSTRFAHGPGGQEFFEAVGDVWMVYHGWTDSEAEASDAQRRLYVDIVEFENQTPRRVGARNSGLVFAAVILVGATLVIVVALWWWRRRTRT